MDSKRDEPKNQNRVLLEETFYVLTKKNCVFRVRLTLAGLCLIKEISESNQVKEQTIPIKDIIGCRCLRSKRNESKMCACQSIIRRKNLKVVTEESDLIDDSDVSAYLYIYAYTLQNSNQKRERTIITLRFRSFDKYEDNNKEAQRWRTTIKRLIRDEPVTIGQIHDFSLVNRHREDRRLLVLCNPKSGPGKGRLIFQQKVVPILQEAEVPYDLHITKYANFARDFVRTCNISQWTGIVVVGGDGIVYEVINGIFERYDWSEIIEKIPIGIIPSGSGNGLARSIAHYCSEPYLPSPTLPSALSIIRHSNNKTISNAVMDLVRVETKSQIMYSFLSIGWGFLSDIDIESERLRLFGGQRFTIWSLARLIGLRCYSGKLWYLPSNVPVLDSFNENGNNDVNNEIFLPPEFNLETMNSRERLDSWYSAASKRSAYYSATNSSYQSTTDSLNYNNERKTTQEPIRMYGPASNLPCLTSKLPPTKWKCKQGPFIMVHASYQSHLSEDCFIAPNAKLNDGIIWLLIVNGHATRSQLLNFLLGLSNGEHAQLVNQSHSEASPIELLTVNAFRIEPDLTGHGYITVDGENVEYGPIQAEIFPGLCRVMVP